MDYVASLCGLVVFQKVSSIYIHLVKPDSEFKILLRYAILGRLSLTLPQIQPVSCFLQVEVHDWRPSYT